MIDSTIRACAVSLLLATAAHHPEVQVGLHFHGSQITHATVKSRSLRHARQLARDLRALKVTTRLDAGFAEREAVLRAELV